MCILMYASSVQSTCLMMVAAVIWFVDTKTSIERLSFRRVLKTVRFIWSHSLVVRTLAFQAGDMVSTTIGTTISGCWGVWSPRHIWDVENSRVRIAPPRPQHEECARPAETRVQTNSKGEFGRDLPKTTIAKQSWLENLQFPKGLCPNKLIRSILCFAHNMESKPRRTGHRLLSGWWGCSPCASNALLSAICA